MKAKDFLKGWENCGCTITKSCEEHDLAGERRRIIYQIRDEVEKQVWNEALDAVQAILLDEIVVAHTTESGKTSRLTSAIMRLNKLRK